MNPKMEPGHGAECVRHKEKIAQGERERGEMWTQLGTMSKNVNYIRGRIDEALKTNGSGTRRAVPPPPSIDSEAVTITIPKAIFLAVLTTILGAIATYLTILR